MIRMRSTPRAAHDNDIDGFVSAKAQWIEDIIIRDENGANVTGVTTHTWQFQFRYDGRDTSTDLTLASGGSGLTVAESGGVTTLSIDTALHADLEGTYVADLVSKASDKIYHRGHGRVTFQNSPVSF